MTFNSFKDAYRNGLLDNVLPFWRQYSPDDQYGGYFTCLDRKGQVYDTDKFVWLQGRQVWTFAMLYNEFEKRQEWLDFALQGAEFLARHGMDKEGNWYFSLNREGKPLVQPYNIFSDCFAAMAFGQLYKATQDPEHERIARETFYNILKRRDNPKGIYSKTYPGTRPLQSFDLPMILSNLVLEIEHILPEDLVNKTIDDGIDTVMNTFYHPELGAILENVQPDGSFSDSFEGRLINPGHGLEAMWFMMDLGERKKDQELIQKAVNITMQLLELGWDKEYEGIYYFLDIKGYPPQQLEWNQKLWWVQLEATIALLKAYMHTGEKKYWEWFDVLHDYSWKYFGDHYYRGWYGYLNRKVEVLMPLKGGKWKGCFHVPRAFFQMLKTLEQIEEKSLYPA